MKKPGQILKPSLLSHNFHWLQWEFCLSEDRLRNFRTGLPVVYTMCSMGSQVKCISYTALFSCIHCTTVSSYTDPTASSAGNVCVWKLCLVSAMIISLYWGHTRESGEEAIWGSPKLSTVKPHYKHLRCAASTFAITLEGEWTRLYWKPWGHVLKTHF